MHERFGKLLLAILAGGIMGFAVGMLFSHSPYFAWTGAIAGGVTGYLTVEFRKVVAAVPVAFRRATSWNMRSKLGSLLQRNWEALRVLGYLFAGTSMTCFSISLPFPLFCELATMEERHGLSFSWGKPTTPLELAVVMSIAISAFLSLVSLLGTPHEANNREKLTEDGKMLLRYLNPLAAWFYWPTVGFLYALYWSGWGLDWFFSVGLPEGVRFGGRFLKHLILLIHSEKRLAAMVYGAILATVTYFAESFPFALTVSSAGAAIGELTYRYLPKPLPAHSPAAATNER